MIYFEEDVSIYFKRNKEYILKIQEQLDDFQFEGECNSFGYKVFAKNYDYTQTKIEFHKAQFAGKSLSTHYNYQVLVNANISNNRVELIVEKSNLKRFLMTSDCKMKFTKPFFVKSSHLSEESLSKIYNFIIKEEIDSVKVKDGKLEIKIFKKKENPLEILQFFQKELF